MADAITGKTEVDATIQELVSAQVQMVLNASVVVPGTITQYPAGKGMDKLKIPRIGKFTVATKAENVAVDAQVNAASTDDLDLDQYKVVQFLVEDIAGIQSNIDVMGEYINQAAKDMATEMDQFLINVLEGTSVAAPDHRRAYAGASIAKADILLARQLLNEQNCPLDARTALIAPDQEASLLAISEFVRIDESGGSEALRNGRIGRLFGFDFYVSTQVESLKSLFYHKSAAAHARQMEPKIEYFRDVPNLSDRWSISHIYGGKMLDSGKRAVLLGTA